MDSPDRPYGPQVDEIRGSAVLLVLFFPRLIVGCAEGTRRRSIADGDALRRWVDRIFPLLTAVVAARASPLPPDVARSRPGIATGEPADRTAEPRGFDDPTRAGPLSPRDHAARLRLPPLSGPLISPTEGAFR